MATLKAEVVCVLLVLRHQYLFNGLCIIFDGFSIVFFTSPKKFEKNMTSLNVLFYLDQLHKTSSLELTLKLFPET